MEFLLLARKVVLIVAGITFQDSFWVLIACISSYALMWMVLIRWKPYATQGSQFDARFVQAVILMLLVRHPEVLRFNWSHWNVHGFVMLNFRFGFLLFLLPPRVALQLLMLARSSDNIPGRVLLWLEAAWCTLYFATIAYLSISCFVSEPVAGSNQK